MNPQEGQGSDPRMPQSPFSASYIQEICQKPEDVQFLTNSTEKKGTTYWEAVLLPHRRTIQTEIQIR